MNDSGSFKEGRAKLFERVIFALLFLTLPTVCVGDVMMKNKIDDFEKPRSFWINKFNMIPHIEGGYFKYEFGSEVWRKTAEGEDRKNYSGIYFMVTHDSPSHFHQMKSDEIWYYHAGSALTMHIIDEKGEYRTLRIGPDPERGESLSAVMRAGWIFGSSVDDGDYGLVSCLVVPGYDDADYRLVVQSDLLEKYPQYRDIIMRMAYKAIPK